MLKQVWSLEEHCVGTATLWLPDLSVPLSGGRLSAAHFILIDSLLKFLFHYHISYSASAIRCLQAGTNWFGFDIDVVHKLQGIGLIFRMNLAKTIEPIAVIGTS